VTIRASATPDWAAASRANASNRSVAKTTVGKPFASSLAVSWRLHDVQDPQSAEPVKASSASPAIVSISSS
jgi:hypothetical protein